MSGDLKRIRACQAVIRREAMRYTTEEAMNALAAVAAEAIGTVPGDDRRKLFAVFGAMIQAALDAIAKEERRGRVLPGLGSSLN
ncbi:MAG: hypothetical protein KGL39_04975 [Patescibacteria group bacterium]|nr:hypothetical protein [Patescibacteria group bacterium]